MLFRKSQLPDASHRYRYALKKIPVYRDKMLDDQFTQIQITLLLNLSRSERRLGHYHEAVQLASEALVLFPECHEGFVARAKANQASGKTKEALLDFYHAHELSPESREIKKAISKLRDEIGSENNSVRISFRPGSAESLVNRTCEDVSEDFSNKLSNNNNRP